MASVLCPGAYNAVKTVLRIFHGHRPYRYASTSIERTALNTSVSLTRNETFKIPTHILHNGIASESAILVNESFYNVDGIEKNV